MIRPEDLHLIGLQRAPAAGRSPYQRAVARRRRSSAIAWTAFLLFLAAVVLVRTFLR